MPDTQSLLSVGIDVGTTTTQVVFSRLQLANVARTGLIPRVSITAREILYQSPIMLTPLQDEQTIDAEKLQAIVRQEYAAAQVDPGQVETGAVIITGETAKKKNADAILQALTGLAGEFIVSIAGPNVESLISGRGSGAGWRLRSRQPCRRPRAVRKTARNRARPAASGTAGARRHRGPRPPRR